MTHSHAASSLAAFCFSICAVVTACGGGGGNDAPAAGTGVAVDTSPAGSTTYAHSVALGASAALSIDYTPGTVGVSPFVTSASAASLLAAGRTTLVAEHVEAALPGLRVACVSGNGESTNVIAPINLGVVAESAAVLLDTGWQAASDNAAAWAAIDAAGGTWAGWENCGVKPEGLPSPSSRLTFDAGGGYREDVYDGNPSTTFNTITQTVSAAQVAAMLSPDGYASTVDPSRPLRLYWRVYGDGAGHDALLQIGLPAAGAPAGTRGFIAPYFAVP